MTSTQKSSAQGKSCNLAARLGSSIIRESSLLSSLVQFDMVWTIDKVAIARCRAGPAKAKEDFKESPDN